MYRIRCKVCHGSVHTPAPACPWCGSALDYVPLAHCDACERMIFAATRKCPWCGLRQPHHGRWAIYLALLLVTAAVLIVVYLLRLRVATTPAEPTL